MKKTIVLLAMILIALTASAQTSWFDDVESDSTTVQSGSVAAYKLFKTENIWTFIKLNTRNGVMEQVQFSFDDEKRFETYLNLIPLVIKSEEVNGRFTLYPTQNVYNFILLDQIDGRTFQVQWSHEPEKRAVVPISSEW
ncbi:MAG: hypothetical protein LBN06_11515 [Prevotellaceae bacterium]|jgi:uncharacterized protein YxeA|nr:hypothetical protein [Prevotellaceae bacterium]